MFTRRYTEIPTLETIREIEGPVIVDIAPPDAVTGAGTGAVLLVGEFEDGPFATEVSGAYEAFGAGDFLKKAGALGYTYDGVVSSNPCARRRAGELWNGNGYIKAFGLKCKRMFISRVDTSVGSVAFDVQASIAGSAGPYVMANSDFLAIGTQTGVAITTAVSAAIAVVTGTGGAFVMANGDTIGIKIDGRAQINVIFGAADATLAAVVSKINTALGYTAASDATSELRISGVLPGTDGSIQLIDVVAGTLAKLGHTAATTAGTGNVGNVNAVTPNEFAALVNVAAITAIDAVATIGHGGVLQISSTDTSTAGYVNVASLSVGAKLGFDTDLIGTDIAVADHPAGTINAGTRVRASGTSGSEWVTMQTIEVEAGEAGPFIVKVRHAYDDGNGLSALASAVDTVVDASDIGTIVVNNASALSAALNENLVDNAYLDALNATLSNQGDGRDANYLLIARRTDAIVRMGIANADKATADGLVMRKYITGAPLGTTTSEIVASVANFRSDRNFYTGKGLLARVPAIASRGTAGGLGFTADGVITVRPDGPLTSVCAVRPPEENPGQETHLIDSFYSVDSAGEDLTIEHYKAYKRAGVVVPIYDSQLGMMFYSGVTSSLESGKTTIARRKMADFLLGTIGNIIRPPGKKLSTVARRLSIRTSIESFLSTLKSEDNSSAQRIEDFNVDDSENAGNTSASVALGVWYIKIVVKTLAHLDNIVILGEIGPNASVVSEAA